VNTQECQTAKALPAARHREMCQRQSRSCLIGAGLRVAVEGKWLSGRRRRQPPEAANAPKSAADSPLLLTISRRKGRGEGGGGRGEGPAGKRSAKQQQK
jgi:hypothetical protein